MHFTDVIGIILINTFTLDSQPQVIANGGASGFNYNISLQEIRKDFLGCTLIVIDLSVTD